jgi:hypothetical protein
MLPRRRAAYAADMGEVTERVISGPENWLGDGAFAHEMAVAAGVLE